MAVIKRMRKKRKPKPRKRKAPTPGVKRRRRYPEDPTENWTGTNAMKYAKRFVFTPDQLDRHWKRNYSREGRRHYVEEALLDQPKESRILEVGCNVGNQLVLLKDLGFLDLHGIEIFDEAVDIAVKRRLDVSQGDARALPFQDDNFDIAMTCWCLTHIGPNEWEKAIDELFRVARTVFISEPAAPLVPLPGKPPMKLSERDWTVPGYLWCRDIYTLLRERQGINITYIQWCGLPGRVQTQMIVARRDDD